MLKEQAVYKYGKMDKNFMTPEVIKWEVSGYKIKELSRGEGIGGEKVWGVSVWDFEDEFQRDHSSRLFYNYYKARLYYNSI